MKTLYVAGTLCLAPPPARVIDGRLWCPVTAKAVDQCSCLLSLKLCDFLHICPGSFSMVGLL